MAFYIYEEPAFSMEHFYPGYCRSLRSMNMLPMNRQWSLMENLEVDKTNEENQIIEPKIQTVSKPFMSKVSCQETLEQVEMKIQFQGHKFKAENLDIQVVNRDILIVKAKDDEETFERKFKLPSNTLANTLVEEISSKFDVKEEDFQTLLINIPKDVKFFQVPIVMEE